MITDWSALMTNTKWIPLRDSGIQIPHVIDGLTQLDEQTFAVVVPHDAGFRPDAPDAPFISALVRAPDISAARRAVLLEVEGDRGCALAALPEELAAGRLTYRGLLERLTQSGEGAREFASYRAASDGAFVHRVVESGNLSFYFRDVGNPDEIAYAILLHLPRGR